ncbi:MAG: trypsin-like peptidase domain-containing protein, partial [Actinomycetota bacterium]|nr:trypsin-like peptidase domain-containing protein [Actinomycetota bacterium]
MDNDTPAAGSEESHLPFMSEGNEAEASSVQTGMDEPTTPNNLSTPAGTSVESDPTDQAHMPEEDATSDVAVGPASDTSMDTGELTLPGDVTHTEFVYENPYAAPAKIEPTAQAGEDAFYSETVPGALSTQASHTPPKESTGAVYFVGALVAAVLGALLTIGILAATGTFDDPVAVPPVTAPAATTVTAAPIVTEITNNIGSAVNPTAVALKVFPSIVTVVVFEDGPGGGDPEDRVGTGSGSGVVMSSDGYLITNHHVIEGATSYTVTFEDGRTYEADLIGSDALTDLAVLQISADGLVPIVFGSADELSIGDPAIAVGNPLGQEGGSSISAGIISAFGRQIDFADESSLFGMIQTDAAINSGSSGGALVDAEGRLIGITSAIGVSTAGPEGIGYAIPIELVDRITAELIETGDVIHPFIGVTMQSFFDLAPDGAIVPSGAVIESIESGAGSVSAAGDAGIEAGDVIVDIGGKSISSQSDLILAVRLYRVGDTVTFT